MGRVKVLPPDIISKIAAGEVIERPASVIKELAENSLDSGATSLEVHLKGAGKACIRVKDNGSGIERDDLEKIFSRHCTSKISSLQDLFSIGSLGFRGEALYSISAVSDVILRSRTASSDSGWEIHQRGQEKISLKPVSTAAGTEIEIKELFFNTPARKKFLKSDAAELHQALNTFLPYCILYPRIRFLFSNNNKPLIDLREAKDHVERASAALNLKPANMIESRGEIAQNQIKLHVILGDINIQRARRDMQFIFVNGRPVQNRAISFNVNEALKLILPPHVSGFFAVYIDMPREDLDVNIHPSKREVKMKGESAIAGFLRSFCARALMDSSKPKQAAAPSQSPIPKTYVLNDARIPDEVKESVPAQYFIDQNYSRPVQPEATLKHKLTAACYIGPLMNKYLLYQAGDSLLVVDQHAAQERISYELLKKQLAAQAVESQHLLSPVILRLTPQEMVVWEIVHARIETIGLVTTLWDKESIALHTHPKIINDPQTAVRNLLDIDEHSHFDDDMLARRACRNSLMTGYVMAPEQAGYLCRQLNACDDPFTCPHGRPTVIEISDGFLEKQFLR